MIQVTLHVGSVDTLFSIAANTLPEIAPFREFDFYQACQKLAHIANGCDPYKKGRAIADDARIEASAALKRLCAIREQAALRNSLRETK